MSADLSFDNKVKKFVDELLTSKKFQDTTYYFNPWADEDEFAENPTVAPR